MNIEPKGGDPKDWTEALGPEWARLPRMSFTRRAPTDAREEEIVERVQNVRTAERIAAEFENRKKFLIEALAPPPPSPPPAAAKKGSRQAR